MIIYRYLCKEITSTLAALTIVLMLIFLSNQFVSYLTRAAGGQFSGIIIFKLLALEIPNLLGLLLPLGMFMAILMAYGRMYAENEMTVLESCGLSQRRLLAITMMIAVATTLIVSVLVLWLGPKIQRDRDFLLTAVGPSAFLEMLPLGRFQALAADKVVYIQSRGEHAENIFVAQRTSVAGEQKTTWDVILAKKAYVNTGSGVRDYEELGLEKGIRYEGMPGTADFQVAAFDQYRARLLKPKPKVRSAFSVMPTLELWSNPDSELKKMAELQWRLSIPLMTLLLAFLAVPLSRVRPRQGKYAKILPAIIIYMLYANMLFVARKWVESGAISPWIGMWWLHLIIAFLGLWLYAKPYVEAKLRGLR